MNCNKSAYENIIPCNKVNEKIVTKKNKLKLVNTNFQSIVNKVDKFYDLIQNFDDSTIIGVTETWLKSNDHLRSLNDKFLILRRDRRQDLTHKTRGGGVLLNIPRKFKPIIRDDISENDSEFDSLWVQFNICGVCYLINISYCSKKQSFQAFEENLYKEICIANQTTNLVIIMGDYNQNYLCEIEKRKINDLIDVFNMEVLNKNIPTHINFVKSSLIDYIITDISSIKTYEVFVTDFFISDHLLTCAILDNIMTQTDSLIYSTKRFYSKKFFNNKNFLKELINLNWNDYYFGTTVDQKMIFIIDNLTSIYHKLCPIIKIQKHNVKNSNKTWKIWISKETKECIRKKHKAYAIFCQNRSKANYDHYKTLRNKASTKCNFDLQAFLQKSFNEKKSIKQKWSFISNFLNFKEENEIPYIINDDGEYITNDKEISNILNERFVKLGMNDNLNTKFKHLYHKHRNIRKHDDPYKPRFITLVEFYKETKKINWNKAKGHCEFPPWFLKGALCILLRPLCDLFNQCLAESTYPDYLKIAKVTPIYKKGRKDLAENYRPISVLTIINKIFEKLLFNQINLYVEQNELISKHQFGFQKDTSTNDALLYAVEDWRSKLDRNEKIYIASLDISKAFNSINHSILLEKLKQIYNFSDSLIELLNSYLSNRYQYVKLNEEISNSLEINHGVPQGSVLGPLLFKLYVNDMDQHINSNHVQFADDTLIYCNDILNLQENVEKLQSFFNNNLLKLNIEKTIFMVIKNRRNESTLESIKICNNIIHESPKMKYLGVVIDNKLNFEDEANNIIKKMAYGIRSIQKIGKFIPIEWKVILFRSLVLSHFLYSSCLLTNLNKKAKSKLEKVFKWGINIISNKNKKEIMCKYHLRSLEALQNIRCLSIFWKRKSNISNHLNQRTITFGKTKYNRKVMKNGFLNYSISLWNKLDYSTRSEKNFTIFKKKLKNMITQQNINYLTNYRIRCATQEQ